MGEQLEEGEIVDDDDDENTIHNFEDISDNSIIDCNIGKFVSTNEHLPALSLSSVSETDVPKANHTKRRRKKSIKRRTYKHLKRYSRITLELANNEDSSDTDDYRDNELKGKLKEAVRIEDENVQQNRNSLRTRLQLGAKNYEGDSTSSNSEQQQQQQKVDDKNTHESCQNSTNHVENNDRFDDPELENLRLEALKTAVINKFQKRKKRKAQLSDDVGTQNVDNKENDTDADKVINKDITEDVIVKKPCIEQNLDDNTIKVSTVPFIDPEDDEDLLRAKLLAGLARKITKTKEPQIEPMPQEIPINQIQLPKPQPKKLALKPKIPNPSQLVINNNKKKEPPPRSTPVVKPLIINLNADSDTDDDIKPNATKNKKPLDDLVEKFLKEQRAKVESQQITRNLQKPTITTKQALQVNKKVNTIVQNTLKPKATKLVKKPQNLEKSAMKLLPKSAQLEYQELLRRLKFAEIKQKISKRKTINNQKMAAAMVRQSEKVRVEKKIEENERIIVTKTVPNHIEQKITQEIVTTTTCIEVESPVSVPIPQSLSPSSQPSPEPTPVPLPQPSPTNLDVSADAVNLEAIMKIETSKSGVLNQLATLQKTLKEIRIQKNGSLQMKNKYQVLTPVMKKINEASKERKKYENIVKKLLRDLNDARSSLMKSHEKFSEHVRELVDKKAVIDKSFSQSDKVLQKNNILTTCTNNNNNNNIKKTVTSDPEIMNKSIENNQVMIITSTPIKIEPLEQKELPFGNDNTSISTITIDKNNTLEDMELCSNEDEPHIDIVDPNDIDQIYKKRPPKCHVPEYVSPLTNYDRFKNMDPYGVMCPYEVNGSCRDSECIFKHFLKNPDQR